jgi:hypothetical protein
VKLVVRDTGQLLQTLEFDWNNIIRDFKVRMGTLLLKRIKELFNTNGEATINTDPLNPGGINPKWKELSPVTIKLKGSSSILRDENQLLNTIKYIIEDMDSADPIVGTLKEVVKLGWFEDSGGYNDGTRYLSTPHLAAIHEYGLTGKLWNTPDGKVMGGLPVGRTTEARQKIRDWFYRELGYKVSGVVVIPERSMLRKTGDLVALKLDELFNTFFNAYLLNYINNP